MNRGHGRPERRLAGLTLVIIGAICALAPAPAGAAISVKSFTATSTTYQAGGHPDLTMSMRFCDQTGTDTNNKPKYCSTGDFIERSRQFQLTMPPGLIATPRAVTTCTTVATSGCPASSKVGTFDASVVLAANSTTVPVGGNIYSIPTKGSELMRLVYRIEFAGMDPVTIEVPITVGDNYAPIASSTDVPGTVNLTGGGGTLDFKLVTFTMRFDGVASSSGAALLSNPTACGTGSISLKANSWLSPSFVTAPAVPYTTLGCAALPFNPSMNVSAGRSGETSRGSTPPINVAVGVPTNAAAIQRSTIVFPTSLRPSVAALSRHACDPAAHAAGNCPAYSVIGSINAQTALAAQPLQGPIYLVKRPGSLEIGLSADLHGLVNVTVEGVGSFDGNRSVASFDNLPDAPITNLAISLTGGSSGVFTAVDDLCDTPPRADATLVGKNGKITQMKVPIDISGCSGGSMTIQSGAVTVTNGYAPVIVTCKAGGSCSGTLSLAGGASKSGVGKEVKGSVGSTTFKVSSGSSKTVGVKLNSAALRILKKKHKLAVGASSTLGAKSSLVLKPEAKAKKKAKKKRKAKKAKKARRG